ncbi:unnamed protein product [Closterium sp. Naga37s-1]|nr:unnamed protein product [Closterium sp. Naga37s-1]
METLCGVAPGERVCIAALNSSAYVQWLLAVPAVGAILAPLNRRWVSASPSLHSLSSHHSSLPHIQKQASSSRCSSHLSHRLPQRPFPLPPSPAVLRPRVQSIGEAAAADYAGPGNAASDALYTRPFHTTRSMVILSLCFCFCLPLSCVPPTLLRPALLLSILPPYQASRPLTTGVMAVYFVFLCWSAIMSEPPAEACNARPRQTRYGGWLDILAFIVALISIAISVYATGINSRCFSLRPGCQDEESAGNGEYPPRPPRPPPARRALPPDRRALPLPVAPSPCPSRPPPPRRVSTPPLPLPVASPPLLLPVAFASPPPARRVASRPPARRVASPPPARRVRLPSPCPSRRLPSPCPSRRLPSSCPSRSPPLPPARRVALPSQSRRPPLPVASTSPPRPFPTVRSSSRPFSPSHSASPPLSHCSSP